MVNAHREALRKLWDGLCDVYVRKTEVNKANGRDAPEWIRTVHRQPCRLSFSTVSPTTARDDAALIRQTVKLFLAKDVDVPPGSKLVVTQEGRTRTYVDTGEPAVYRHHQEITLERKEEWA